MQNWTEGGGEATKQEQLLKLMDQAELAKLMAKIRNQHNGQFMEEWQSFFGLFGEEKTHNNQMKSQAGFEI